MLLPHPFKGSITGFMFVFIALVFFSFGSSTSAQTISHNTSSRAMDTAEDTCPPPYNCADGFYEAPGWNEIFAGGRAYMDSANPQIRDTTGYSAMRVGVIHSALEDPNGDLAFVEGGWSIWPTKWHTNKRLVYGSARDTSGTYYIKTYDTLADGDINPYWYRVAVNPSNQDDWVFKFNTVRKDDVFPGFSRGTTVLCGGESTNNNAIGVSGCQNVAYWRDDLGPWIALPNHLSRVTPGYGIVNGGPAFWQSFGQN